MANGGEGVSGGNQLSLGGAEPLLTHVMSVGHYDSVRPSRIFKNQSEIVGDYNQEEIGTTDSGRKRPAEEETRSGQNV